MKRKNATVPAREGERGFTILELVISLTVMAIVMGSVMTALHMSQTAFIENQAVSRMNLRIQTAMKRMVALTSQIVSIDSEYSTTRFHRRVTETETVIVTETHHSLAL